ncbi:RNA polymerase sigma factor [Microlunatus sp. Y2014]|uniref:RNA polymerase sigma factor n=1 Tax=Microlunatus sp. Y2014 TaxID=3418488 RepID=UPI003DA6FFBB
MDEAAFDAFYGATFHRVVSQVYLICGNLTEAQDCAQEAFVRAWDKRRQLDRAGHPEAWVRTVAHRLCISRWRKHSKSDRDPDRALQVPAAQGEPGPDRVAVWRALDQLSVETRRTLVLFYFVDLSVADIAAETGVPEGTVKARLSRGRTTMAKLLGDDHTQLSLPTEVSDGSR